MRDADFAQEHRKFLQEYENVEHMHPLEKGQAKVQNERYCYLPYYGIWQ